MSQYRLKDNSEFTISTICLQSYPCQHDCKLNGSSIRVSGIQICKLFIDNNMPVPEHFRDYLKMVNDPKYSSWIKE